jgi:transcriptional antiterminator RfaH
MRRMLKLLFKTNCWYLLSTKHKLEKIAKENLNNQGHETFLPLIRKKNIESALFPGYIFVKPAKKSSYIAIRSTIGVKGFIKFENKFPIIRNELIIHLKSKIIYFENLLKKQKKYNTGQLVKIESGPFRDFEAVFDCYDKDQSVFILLNFLESTQRIKLKESDLN